MESSFDHCPPDLPVEGSEPKKDKTRIYGGEETELCEFPTTLFANMGCTATLVHPQVVISAAHCAGQIPFRTFTFGEHKNKATQTAEVKWCEKTSFQTTDYAICVIKEPITDVPIAPILQGCEANILKAGQKVLLSGFGYSEDDVGQASGEKRWIETQINSLSGAEVKIGGGGKGGCQGDSGGPAYVQLEDGSWRTIGATKGGAAHPNCDEGIWRLTHVAMDWYEEQLAKHNEDDIDLSPCFDDDGEWAPTKECGGYAKDIKDPFGDWSNGCSEGAPLIEYSATCSPPFSEGDTSPPTVKVENPKNGEEFTKGESVTIRVSAEDDVAVTEVQFFVDDEQQETLNATPYEWSTDDLDLGEHKIHAIALDAAGNEGKSEVVSVEIIDDSDDNSDNDNSSDSNDENSTDKDDKNVSDKKNSGCQVLASANPSLNQSMWFGSIVCWA